jgi:tetratricopeptide (TPR) repeat protein
VYSKILGMSTLLAANLLFAGSATAQDCADLGNNIEYKSLMEKMNVQIQDKDYHAARKTADKLLRICPTVPSVNYALGKIYQELGDQKSAHTHFSIATDNTEEFAVPKDLLKNMWYARYESEFPEAVAFKTGKLEAQYQKALAEGETEELNWAKTVMWSGAGIGIAGVAMAVAGGFVMGFSGIENIVLNESNIEINSETNKYNNVFNLGKEDAMVKYTAGSVLLGVGIGAAVAGAVMAGIGRYKYTQLKAEKDTKDRLETSIAISYNSIALNMTF